MSRIVQAVVAVVLATQRRHIRERNSMHALLVVLLFNSVGFTVAVVFHLYRVACLVLEEEDVFRRIEYLMVSAELVLCGSGVHVITLCLMYFLLN
jgi:formate/nitrite transporter FocA (FNT family)